MHDKVKQVGGNGAALSDSLVLVVCVRVAIGVKDLEQRSRVDSSNLVDDLTREAHSFEDTEESLVVQAVKGFFPVEEGNNAGNLAFLGNLSKSSECEEGLGCTALWSEAVLLIV